MSKDKGVKEIHTLEFKNEIVRQVNKFMTQTHPNLQKLYNESPVSPETTGKPRNLQYILGSRQTPETRAAGGEDHWWRLYIDPQHWDLAQMKSPADPGHFYDIDRKTSVGFQQGMVETYENFLVSNALTKVLVDHKAGDQGVGLWHLHSDVWNSATAHLPEKWDNSLLDSAKSAGGSFDSTTDIAADLLSQKTGQRMMVKEAHMDQLIPERSDKGPCVFKETKNPLLSPQLYSKQLQLVVDQAFRDFRQEVEKAKLRKEQLYAIAKLVRTLHVLHTFEDGCGRVNVFTFLPALLMKFGFGLPLGADRPTDSHDDVGIDRRAIGVMFNGGFSVEEMARFLWAKQDFGLIADLYHGQSPWDVSILAMKTEGGQDTDTDPLAFKFPSVPKHD